MNNTNDWTWFFIVSTLLNTNLGIYNSSKNQEQDRQNQEILDKLDLILEKLNEQY